MATFTALLLMTLVSLTAQGAPQVDAGKLTRISGPSSDEAVNVRNAMGAMTAGQGDQIYVGDVITTGPKQSVVFTLKDESEIVIAASTEFAVKQVPSRQSRSTRLQLLYGLVHALVRKHYSAEQPFVIETPTAVMGVRGTEFIVEHDKSAGQSSVHTLDGTVAMAKSFADLMVPDAVQLVGAGMMSKLLPGMALPVVPEIFDRGEFMEQLKGRAPQLLENIGNIGNLGVPPNVSVPKIEVPKIERPKLERPKLERPTIDAPEEIKEKIGNPLKGLFGS